jgi:hypothetical protein
MPITVTATELQAIAATKKAPRRINWSTSEPAVIPAGQKLVSVSDGTVRYFATVPQKSTVLGIGRAFARGFDHGESTDEVTATIERRVTIGWEYLGRVKFGPKTPVMLA